MTLSQIIGLTVINSKGVSCDVLYSCTETMHSPSLVTCTPLTEFRMYPCRVYHSRIYFEKDWMEDTGSEDPIILERVRA